MWRTKTNAAIRDDGYDDANKFKDAAVTRCHPLFSDDGYSESSDEQRRARQSAMMATAKQMTNKDERGVPRTTVTTGLQFFYH